MQSYPFTSQVTYDEQGLPLYDRAVDSAFLRKVFAAYFSDGVFYNPTNALQVVAGTGMQVQVNPGICHIQGAMGIEPNLRTLSLTAAGSQPRIDTVVARLDLSQAVRSIELYVKTGTPAASPSAPSLTRDSTIWELGLANVSVGANVGTISQSNITDTRLDISRCGLVAQTIGDLDTSPYFAQLTAQIAAHQEEAETQIALLKAAIEAVEGDSAWMMKTLYDPQDLREDLGIQLYTHSKQGTVHNFVGTGMNGRALITAAFQNGDTVQLNGVSVTATCGADPVDGDTIVNGRWVSFVADAEGGQINFKGGGGLGNSRLKQATAGADMVSEDATFYAGNKTLKTGTLAELGQAQTAGSIGGGGNSDYYAFNDIPEGIYRKNGADWAPEIRYDKAKTINYIVGTDRDDVISSLGGPKAAFAGACWGNKVSGGYGATGSSYCTASHNNTSGTLVAKVSGYFGIFRTNQNSFSYKYIKAGNTVKTIGISENDKYLVCYVYI